MVSPYDFLLFEVTCFQNFSVINWKDCKVCKEYGSANCSKGLHPAYAWISKRAYILILTIFFLIIPQIVWADVHDYGRDYSINDRGHSISTVLFFVFVIGLLLFVIFSLIYFSISNKSKEKEREKSYTGYYDNSCQRCKGTGYIKNEQYNVSPICDICGGRGIVLTDAGRNFLSEQEKEKAEKEKEKAELNKKLYEIRIKYLREKGKQFPSIDEYTTFKKNYFNSITQIRKKLGDAVADLPECPVCHGKSKDCTICRGSGKELTKTALDLHDKFLKLRDEKKELDSYYEIYDKINNNFNFRLLNLGSSISLRETYSMCKKCGGTGKNPEYNDRIKCPTCGGRGRII